MAFPTGLSIQLPAFEVHSCCSSHLSWCVLAADIGAAAYASALEGCTMSTQDVILSMLENDNAFRDLLVRQCRGSGKLAWLPCQNTWALSEHGHDIWDLELAVAGVLQHAQTVDASTRSPMWSRKASPESEIGKGDAADGEPVLGGVCMTAMSTADPISDLALRTVYQYWGIPWVPRAVH